jgi:cytochrome b561
MPEQSPFSKIPLHMAMGFTILLLAVARLIYRFICKVPALPADLPAWQAMVARGVQVLIYVLLLTQPLSGWLGGGRPFTYFDIFTMPPVTFLTPYREALHWVHVNGAWALIVLISLHTLGALYHHYIRKDKVLLSMLRGA